MSWDGTHAAYSEMHWLFPQHLVQQALGRVGRATVADSPTFPGPVPQALGFRKPQPVLNSLKGGGWKGREALPACSHHQKQSQHLLSTHCMPGAVPSTL